MARDPLEIGLVAYEGLCTFEFGIMVELFGLPRPEFERWYRLRVAGERRGPLRAAGGVTVEAPVTWRALATAGTIVIPGWRRPYDEIPAALLRAVRRAHDEGARVLSVCSGAFVLAEAGLLDGRRATTHWRYAEELAANYPAVSVDPDVLYVDEGSIMTSAGSAAGVDLGLHLIARDFGAAVASQVARRLVVPPHRDGGQRQFIDAPLGPAGGASQGRASGDDESTRISRSMASVRRRIQDEHTVASMARSARMSERTFARRFRDATGTTPHRWLVSERVERARRLLETTTHPMDEVARRAGFGDAQLLRMHFRRSVGVAPTSYRRSFKQEGAR